MDNYNKWAKVGEISFGKWIVQCECGKKEVRHRSVIVNGYAKSCLECSYKLRRDSISKSRTSHGKSNCPTQQSYSDMKRRCYSNHRPEYKNYGGRGISVCDRWLNGDGKKTGYHCFLDDMGEREKGFSLERVDVEKNYEPDNCVWATSKEQGNNKRRTPKFMYKGELTAITYIAEDIGMHRNTLYSRIVQHGKDFDDSISNPVKRKPI